jgi:hypothetical protein
MLELILQNVVADGLRQHVTLPVGTAQRGPTGSSCDIELHVLHVHRDLPQGQPRESLLADLGGGVEYMWM